MISEAASYSVKTNRVLSIEEIEIIEGRVQMYLK